MPEIHEAAEWSLPASRFVWQTLKGSLRCWHCRLSWTQEIPEIDLPVIKCPGCGAYNRISVKEI